MRTQYVRLHEGFATDLGLQLKSNLDPAGAAELKPQSFRCFCYAPQGFNTVAAVPAAGMPAPSRHLLFINECLAGDVVSGREQWQASEAPDK